MLYIEKFTMSQLLSWLPSLLCFKKIINDIIEMFRENLKKRTISVALFVVFVFKKSNNKNNILKVFYTDYQG